MNRYPGSTGIKHAGILVLTAVVILCILVVSGCSGRKQVLLVTGPYSAELFPEEQLQSELTEYLKADGYRTEFVQVSRDELAEMRSSNSVLPADLRKQITALDKQDVLFFTPEFSELTCSGSAYVFLNSALPEQDPSEHPGRVLTLAAFPGLQVCAEVRNDPDESHDFLTLPVSKERVWNEIAWELQRIANDRSLFFLYHNGDPEGEHFRQTLEQILPKGAIGYAAFPRGSSVTSQQIVQRIDAEAENLGTSYQDIKGKLLLVSDLGMDNAASLQLAEQNGGKCIIEGASYIPHVSSFIYASLEIDPGIIIAESIRRTDSMDKISDDGYSTVISRGWSIEYCK